MLGPVVVPKVISVAEAGEYVRRRDLVLQLDAQIEKLQSELSALSAQRQHVVEEVAANVFASRLDSVDVPGYGECCVEAVELNTQQDGWVGLSATVHRKPGLYDRWVRVQVVVSPVC